MNKDFTHIYCPISFTDFGEVSVSPGYDYELGNVVLTRKAKPELLSKIPTRDSDPRQNDFIRSIQNETFWHTLQHLNAPFSNDIEDGPYEYFHNLLGSNCEIQEALDFAINSALYTARRPGKEGYSQGHTDLLKELRNPQSIAYNIGRPNFKRRVVNGAFWEQIGNNNDAELEIILSQESGLLDPSFLEQGYNILFRNKGDDLSYYIMKLGLERLSKGALVNFSYFIEGMKTYQVPKLFKEIHKKLFIDDYIKAIESKDCDGVEYFSEKEIKGMKSKIL